MAFTNLHISEFSDIASGKQANDLPILDASTNLANQELAIGVLTTSSAFQSANPAQFGPSGQAVGSVSRGTSYVLLYADIGCDIAFGAAPVATLVGWYMGPGTSLLVKVPNSQSWKVSVIADTT